MKGLLYLINKRLSLKLSFGIMLFLVLIFTVSLGILYQVETDGERGSYRSC